MYKLTVVAGPARGSSFAINKGENWVGRQAGNVVVLPSAKISKRHCVLVVDNTRVTVEDSGSSNGTFVNGQLTQRKDLKPGDRISVGEYVLELTEPKKSNTAMPVQLEAHPNIYQFPQLQNPIQHLAQGAMPGAGEVAAPAGPPKDLKGKVTWAFENQLMPVFYGLNLKYEWKAICVALFVAFLFANLILSVYPVVTASRAAAMKEVGRRASYMARDIADRNARFLAERQETKADLGGAADAEGVRVAVLTDLELRVIAPSSKMNDYLTIGAEAITAKRARDRFRAGRETGVATEVSEVMIAVEPVRVYNAAVGRNVTVAMAVVSIDSALLSSDLGEMGLIFSETLILTGLVGALLLLILYRMTIRPFEVLGDDIDRVLKGEATQVTREFQFPEMNSLWDLINSSLQRATASTSGSQDPSSAGLTVDDAVNLTRALSSLSPAGIAVCDSARRIVFINDKFEEITGIRSDGSIGQDFSSVARDQAMGAFTADLFDRSIAGMSGEIISEDYEFSGNAHRVFACAASGGKCFILMIAPTPGGDG